MADREEKEKDKKTSNEMVQSSWF